MASRSTHTQAQASAGQTWMRCHSFSMRYGCRQDGRGGKKMLQRMRMWPMIATVLLLTVTMARAQNVPAGQLTIAFDTTIAPSYLDPAEVAGLATPFVFLYALHDALLKPLPGNNMAPCLAESWTESPDGLVYEFKLRAGLTFHNGDPFTAVDVQFTFARYK